MGDLTAQVKAPSGQSRPRLDLSAVEGLTRTNTQGSVAAHCIRHPRRPEYARYTARHDGLPIPELLDDAVCIAWLKRHLHPTGLACSRCQRTERRLFRRLTISRAIAAERVNAPP